MDMEVRWLSTFYMIKRFAKCFPVFEQWRATNRKNDTELCFSNVDLALLQQLEAILEPLILATTMLETSNVPTAQVVLPMIYAICATYGINVGQHGILEGIDESDRFRHIKHLKFTVSKENVAVTDMHATAQSFVRCLQKHLYYRLIKLRSNQNGPELLACYVDPLFNRYFNKLCDENQREDIPKSLDSVIEAFARNSAGSAKTKISAVANQVQHSQIDDAFRIALDESEDSSDDELQSYTREKKKFRKECIKFQDRILTTETRSAITIPILASLMKKSKVLEFWDADRRSRFPSFYKVSKVMLAVVSTSCRQESVFSSAGDTLTSRRRRLVANPDLLEALVVMRCVYSLKYSSSEIEDEELDETESSPSPSEKAVETQVEKKPAKNKFEVLDLVEVVDD